MEKHPNARDVDAEVLIPKSATQVQPVIIEEITAEKVQKTARDFNGSGGLSMINLKYGNTFSAQKRL